MSTTAGPPTPVDEDPEAGERQDVDGPEAAALLDQVVTALGGQRREGQVRMAEAVTDAIRTRRHLLVQAGTGTGKSMAYLVPAVAHAVHTDRRVVVTTATLALQAQVVERDLPRLAQAIAPALHREPTWELLKGRANYLCRNKLDGGFPSDEGALFDVAAPTGEGPGTRGGWGARSSGCASGRPRRRPVTGTTSTRASATAPGARCRCRPASASGPSAAPWPRSAGRSRCAPAPARSTSSSPTTP